MTKDSDRIDEYNRRLNDRLTNRVDEIFHIVTRTETQVQELMGVDAHTRLCNLESAHKFWKNLFFYGSGAVGAAIVALLEYFK